MPLRDRLGKLLLITLIAALAPTSSIAQPAPSVPGSPAAEYVIGVEDVLDIVVWREEDVTLTVTDQNGLSNNSSLPIEVIEQEEPATPPTGP